MFITITTLLVSTIAVYITAYLLPGVRVDNPFTALVIAFVLAFLNTFLLPPLLLFSLPLSFLTFGLFPILLIAFMVWLAAKIISGFQVDHFGYCILFGISLFLVESLLKVLF